MTKIEQILKNNPTVPVLFVSDPENGDRFEFGTLEELEGEREAREAHQACEVATAGDLLARLDFGAYEGDDPTIVL